MNIGDLWLLSPYVEMGACIFIISMAHIMTVRESFKQSTWQHKQKNIIQTSQNRVQTNKQQHHAKDKGIYLVT